MPRERARRPASTQTDTVPTSRVMCAPANPFEDFGNSVSKRASCSFLHLRTRSEV